MVKKFKISFGDHFRHLWGAVFLTLLLPLALYFLIGLRGRPSSNYNLFGIALFAFCLYILPGLVLHLNHIVKNRFDELILMPKGLELIKLGKKIQFNWIDVDTITSYKSRPLSEERTPVLIWDSYNYTIIKLKDGREFKISSLLVNELDKKIPFDNVEIKKTFYAWMS